MGKIYNHKNKREMEYNYNKVEEDSIIKKIRIITNSMEIPIIFEEFLIEQERRILGLENTIQQLKDNNDLYDGN